MKNYIKEYFTNPRNVMNQTLLTYPWLRKVTPDEFFQLVEPEQEKSTIIFKHIVCKDWFKMSVQASHLHYCKPRCTCYSKYSFIYDTMEVWYPSEKVEELMPYCYEEEEWEWVYGQVPVELLNKIIDKHWGIKEEVRD